MTEKTMTPDELVPALKQAVHEIGKHLEPDGDWQPVAFVLSPGLGVVPVTTDGLANETDKEVFCAAIAGAIAIGRATACVLIMPAWMVVPEEGAARALGDQFKAFEAEHGREPSMEELGLKRPTESPDRFEALVINRYEPGRSSMEYAEVMRSDSFPVLGEWVSDFEDAEDAKLGGRFAEAIGDALEHVRKAATAKDN